MESLYWLSQSLTALPLALWVYFGIGIPYALLLLPRKDWQNRAMVLVVSFAAGPALLTAWMFILGTSGGINQTSLLRFDLILAGTILLFIIGVFLAWRKSKSTTPSEKTRTPLAFDERLLIILIVAAIALRWIVVAYWSFTAYDALWVYGYQGRLWFLNGFISPDIGYYPQFLQLQLAFMQLGVGAIDDHAARVVVPFLQWGSILAAYVLGSRLINRRTGLILAALWTLYPHLGMWSHVSDLEVPITFLFTATCAFFLMAWMSEETFLRRRYALIAGLIFGVAMWTKPTAGAFVWGVVVAVIIEFLRVGFDWRKWYPRFEVALITGLACIPLGAIWYIRNILLGHPAIIFPHPSWLTLATRSGDLLSWLVLALFLLIAYLASTRILKSGQWILFIGISLILIGTMPSSPQIIRLDSWLGLDLLDTSRLNPPESRLKIYEWILIFSGVGICLYHLRAYLTDESSKTLHKVGWAWILALPYFMTWFWSYSYHARLSFAIVPLMAFPSAIVLSRWVESRKWRFSGKIFLGITILILGIPGIIVPFFSLDHHYDWLWTNRYPDDYAKYKLHNPGVYLTAEFLWGYEVENNRDVVVVAPGEQRLPFFLPQATIITDTIPTQLDDLLEIGATHFVYGSQAQWRYENDEGIDPLQNQIVAALGREDLMERKLNFTTGRFRYELYELHLENWNTSMNGHYIEDDVVFGGFVRYLADSVSNGDLIGNRIFIRYFWEVIQGVDRDYLVRLDLIHQESGEIYATWETPVNPHTHGNIPRTLYYSTQVWQEGEHIIDFRSFQYGDSANAPAGNYKIRVNFVDAETGEILPMTINGEPADGYTMVATFNIRR